LPDDPTRRNNVKVFYSDHFVLPLPEGHRFPMVKYSMLRAPGEMRVPRPVSDEEILRCHTEGYLRRVVSGTLTAKEMRRIGFPWSERMVERSRRASGGTLGACLAALEDGFAANLAGGTHHAFADRGEGYCVFNDSAIAARAVQAEGLVERVVVLDTDVHQGNGTAAILSGDASVYTFSIHGAKNFPFRKEESDLDVALPDGADDGEYLDALEDGLEKALDRSGAQLAIYLAGADPFEDDRLGRLCVTKEGLAERDRLVLESCRERGVPVAVTMAGGYAREVEDTVDIHFQSIERTATLLDLERDIARG
jgi:acetoin utilization deacetylase AcuC-like enzyme